MAYEPQHLGVHRVHEGCTKRAASRITVGQPTMRYLDLDTDDLMVVHEVPGDTKRVLLATPSYSETHAEGDEIRSYRVSDDGSGYTRSRVAGPVTRHLGLASGDAVRIEYGERGEYAVMVDADL